MSIGDEDDLQKYAELEREDAQYEGSDIPGISNESYHPPAERQHPEPQQYAEQRQPQQQAQQQPQAQYADVDEDPILHFQQRANAVESHLQEKAFWDRIHASEAEAHGEVGQDYFEAAEHLKMSRLQELEQQFPDRSHEAQVLAHRHGYQNAAHLRLAILQRDAVTVAQHAMQNGISPAAAFYNLSRQRGWKPKITVGRSQERAVTQALAHAPDKEADILWNWYRSQMMKAEER